HTLEGFDLELSFPEAPSAPGSYSDAAFSDPRRSFRRMVELSVCNPEALDLYAQADPVPSPDAGWEEAAWQPRPEDSPGFPWLVIPVEETGFHTIDGRWLASAGLDLRQVDPGALRLVARGTEVP